MCQLLIFLGVIGLALSAKLSSRIDDKIVGGQDASIQDYPYQISLQYYKRHHCGGSIVAPRFIISAAHCTTGISPKYMTVLTGVSNLRENGQSYQVKRLFTHPEFSYYTFDKDISVVELELEIIYDEVRQPVRLPAPTYDPEVGIKVVVSGWGATHEGGFGSQQLQVVRVLIYDREKCNDVYRTITDNMICANVAGGGKDACQGDSGGPLVGNGELIGVVSWGRGCASAIYPGVYTNVAALHSYIIEHISY